MWGRLPSCAPIGNRRWSGAGQVGTGFSLYGRAQLDRGLEYASEPVKQTQLNSP